MHNWTRTDLLALLWTSDQPVAEAATYTTQQTRQMKIHA